MTGCERILARLEEGPATAAELYATTYTVVHSRISDLRKRGYVIDCEKVDGEGAASYVYTLCAGIGPLPSPSGGSSGAAGAEADGVTETPFVNPAQMSFSEAA